MAYAESFKFLNPYDIKAFLKGLIYSIRWTVKPTMRVAVRRVLHVFTEYPAGASKI